MSEINSWQRDACPQESDAGIAPAEQTNPETNQPRNSTFKERLVGLFSKMSGHAGAASDALRAQIAGAVVMAIRAVANESDRDSIVRWFINARDVMLDSDLSKPEIVKRLYASIDTMQVARLTANTVITGLRSFQASDLPLPLKVALPVTAIGSAIVGAEGAGVAAFGGAVGVPVALLLFLGTAGATSIVEAFIRDRSVRDPLTQLLLTFVEFDNARKARRALLDAMRAEAMTPLRATIPADAENLRAFFDEMHPVEFERHVMSFFADSGHPTGLTPQSNDFGVDGYVFHPEGIIIVQCKRYGEDHPVGRPAIQQFKGVIEEQNALRGYVVTTSRFTQEAQNSASQSERIILIDFVALCDWHRNGFQIN